MARVQSSISRVRLEGNVGRVLCKFSVPGLRSAAASRGHHHCPEAQPGDGPVGLEPDRQFFVFAPLNQETLGQVRTTQPHPSVVLDLDTTVTTKKYLAMVYLIQEHKIFVTAVTSPLQVELGEGDLQLVSG